ncbi:MAG: siphovirus Gp157 family protein [Oscillospiraceae bacterium]|jgi:hypothetical protein|nr:siphovirus Gp157 family protein [Oscillospiraceae bacterium]
MPLYEISGKYLEFFDYLENNEVSDEEIESKLKNLDDEFNKKADSICCFIKNLKSESEAIVNEVNELMKRRSIKCKCAERLTKYLKNQMELVGKHKIETSRNSIVIRQNPCSVLIEKDFLNWARENAEELLKWRDPEPDKLKIKEYLKNGGKLEHVELVQTKRLEIK